jgi:hypothetical protein
MTRAMVKPERCLACENCEVARTCAFRAVIREAGDAGCPGCPPVVRPLYRRRLFGLGLASPSEEGGLWLLCTQLLPEVSHEWIQIHHR